MLIYRLIFHSAYPHHSDHSEAIQHSRETPQGQRARQSVERRGWMVVKAEEEEKQERKVLFNVCVLRHFPTSLDLRDRAARSAKLDFLVSPYYTGNPVCQTCSLGL